jgi:hypothetical protein
MLEDSNAVSRSGFSIFHPDGRGIEISWLYYPFWFKSDYVIVLYVGENEDIIAFLRSIFGENFAGYGR